MEEKVLTNRRHGMPVLIVALALYLAAIAGGIEADRGLVSPHWLQT